MLHPNQVCFSFCHYLHIFATITKKYVVNLHTIFLGFDVLRSVKKVHGGILICDVLFVTAAIFTAVVDVFLGIEMADAGTHRIKIANFCRFCG